MDLFTNRVHAIRRFANYLNEDPPRKQILFFSGDGGNGKSLLMRYLRERCCHDVVFATWRTLRALGDDDDAAFAGQFIAAPKATAIPRTHLDFGLQPRGDERPQEAWLALLALRRVLAEYGLRFPLYDFACFWYMHRTGQLEKYKSLIPDKEIDLLGEFINLAGQNSWVGMGKAVINVIDKHYGSQATQRFAQWRQQRHLSEDDLAAHNNRGNTLQALGNLEAALGAHQAARERYAEAVASLDRALELAPQHPTLQRNREHIVQRLADLQDDAR